MKAHLQQIEHNLLQLRHLYAHFGYVHYKMNRFEAYDLYVANKDFLANNNVITFTDTDGKLLALKPDVTLSIAKNYRYTPGAVQKVYYSENVYRPAGSTKTYKEILQMGLECMGDLDIYQISEVLFLAAKSLNTLTDRYILDLSHMGFINGMCHALGFSGESMSTYLHLLQGKNTHGIQQLCHTLHIERTLTAKAIGLATLSGSAKEILPQLSALCLNETMRRAVDQLSAIHAALSAQGVDQLQLDFSLAGDMHYYNGILLRGYIDGIPYSVLTGGQYDILMVKMGKPTGAIGFAIDLELLHRYAPMKDGADVDILLLYDEHVSPQAILHTVRALSNKTDESTVQAQRTIPPGLRYRKLMKLDGKGLIEID